MIRLERGSFGLIDLQILCRTFGAKLSLTACATLTATGLQSEFVGRPVSEAVAKVGPPTTKSQLGNGRMAFEWLHYGPCTYSMSALGH